MLSAIEKSSMSSNLRRRDQEAVLKRDQYRMDLQKQIEDNRRRSQHEKERKVAAERTHLQGSPGRDRMFEEVLDYRTFS